MGHALAAEGAITVLEIATISHIYRGAGTGKVMLAFAGIALFGIHTAARTDVCAAGSGDLHIGSDLVGETQILVNVVGCRLARRDGTDDRSGAGHAIAVGKYAFQIRKLRTGIK